MAKLVNLIPGREVVKEELDDMDVSLPVSAERFLDRAIRALKGYNLNRKKETLGKCPTRQLFYKYTKPKAFPKH
jgi:hypothetical protein